MKFSLLFILVSLNAFASQPGDRLPFGTFVPGGGGFKGAAKLFKLSLETSPCDQGYIVKIVKAPGLVRRFRLFVQETYRGQCQLPDLSDKQLDYNADESTGKDGGVIFTAAQGADLITLVDRRWIKTDQPAWVALIGTTLYQSTEIAPENLP